MKEEPNQSPSNLFRFTVLFKAFDGFTQLVFGTALAVHSRILQRAIEEFADRGVYINPSTQRFALIYFLAHGVINITLAIGLWQRKRWAYFSAMIFLNSLIVYQIIRLTHTHSVTLFLLTLVDAAVIFVIYRDYQLHFNQK